MSAHISSAQPALLYRYSDIAQRLDHELIAESGRLGNVLRHFEATCREGGMAPRVSHLADALRGYAQGAEPVDRWVHAVGKGFEQADRRSILRLIADWLRGVLRLRPGARSGIRVGPEAPYAGIRVLPRGVGPFAVLAGRVIARLPVFVPYPAPSLLPLLRSYPRFDLRTAVQAPYAGITVLPRTVGPLAIQAARIFARLPLFFPGAAAASLWQVVVPAGWALTKATLPILYRLSFWDWLKWLRDRIWRRPPAPPADEGKPESSPPDSEPAAQDEAAEAEPETPDESPSAAGVPRRMEPRYDVLEQKNPVGDRDVLKAKRYDLDKYNNKCLEYGTFIDREIKTVEDHIANYGCLMTAQTMLLQAKGYEFDVTDLYKQHYYIVTHRNFDDDLRQNDHIVLPHLYAQPSLIEHITEKQSIEKDVTINNSNAQNSIARHISAYGSVIIQIYYPRDNYSHYVVVDSFDGEKFKVRDPLKSHPVEWKIPTDVLPEGTIKQIRYITP